MPRIISVTTQQKPSIVIIQAAYEQLLDPIVNANQYKTFATEPQPVEDWLKFRCLAEEWRAQRGAMSSITEAAACPAYQSIIGMGETAVPFILAQLESEDDEPDQWFWALKAITGADPVRHEDRGDYVAMAKSWLQWAKKSEYAW